MQLNAVPDRACVGDGNCRRCRGKQEQKESEALMRVTAAPRTSRSLNRRCGQMGTTFSFQAEFIGEFTPSLRRSGPRQVNYPHVSLNF
jgi:hypothetical protein